MWNAAELAMQDLSKALGVPAREGVNSADGRVPDGSPDEVAAVSSQSSHGFQLIHTVWQQSRVRCEVLGLELADKAIAPYGVDAAEHHIGLLFLNLSHSCRNVSFCGLKWNLMDERTARRERG